MKYIRVGQLNSDGKIEGLGRMFYVTNAAGAMNEWELKHISEGQCDGPRSGFGRYFEEDDYYHIGWYHKNMHNGYILNNVKGTKSEGVLNQNTKVEVSAQRSNKVDFNKYYLK